MTTPPSPAPEPRTKLWFWKNGDHYLAFDSLYPVQPNGDPAVLGEPSAFALLAVKPAPTLADAAASQKILTEIKECAEGIVRNLREDIAPALRDDVWVSTAVCHATVILQDLQDLEALRHCGHLSGHQQAAGETVFFKDLDEAMAFHKKMHSSPREAIERALMVLIEDAAILQTNHPKTVANTILTALAPHLDPELTMDFHELHRAFVQRGGEIRKLEEKLSHLSPAPDANDTAMQCHGLDTPERVCFYEQDFYILSNFSAFTLQWDGLRFDTSEAAYHWEKFNFSDVRDETSIQQAIRLAPSAHEAYKVAERGRSVRRPNWDAEKVDVMRAILRAKADQHEYVRKKLLATGDRELVENSWRDDFWGWGPNRNGQNMLGKLWMEVRAAMRAEGEKK